MGTGRGDIVRKVPETLPGQGVNPVEENPDRRRPECKGVSET